MAAWSPPRVFREVAGATCASSMFRAICPTGPTGPVKDDEPENDLSLAELSNPLDDEELKEAAVVRPRIAAGDDPGRSQSS